MNALDKTIKEVRQVRLNQDPYYRALTLQRDVLKTNLKQLEREIAEHLEICKEE